MPAKNWVVASMLLKRVVIRSFSVGHSQYQRMLLELRRGKQGLCRVMRVLCWLPQHSPLHRARCVLPNTAGQHCQRNGFYSLLPWRWSDQSANEMSDGAGDIIPYAAGWMGENNQVSIYQSSSSWLVKKVAKGSCKLLSFTWRTIRIQNCIFLTLCELIVHINAIYSIIIASYLLLQIFYYSINY